MKSGVPKKQRLADEHRRKAAKSAGAWDTASKSPPSAIPVSARQKRPRGARGGAHGS